MICDECTVHQSLSDFERTDFTPSIEKKILVNCHLQTRLVCLGSINQSNEPRITSFLKTLQTDICGVMTITALHPGREISLLCNLLFSQGYDRYPSKQIQTFIFSFPLRNVGRTVSPTQITPIVLHTPPVHLDEPYSRNSALVG